MSMGTSFGVITNITEFSNITLIFFLSLQEFHHKQSLVSLTSIDYLNGLDMSSFDDWLASIKQRDGNFSETDKYKIFISQQTHEGLKISINLVTRGSTVFFSTSS